MGAVYAWCLVLTQSLIPYGEPFPVFVRADDRIHDLKAKIKTEMANMGRQLYTGTHELQIWKSKSSRLSANDSFIQTKKQLSDISFSDDENNDIQHLGVSQRVMDLRVDDNELWLALLPQNAF